MPWKEKTTMEQKVEFICEWLSDTGGRCAQANKSFVDNNELINKNQVN